MAELKIYKFKLKGINKLVYKPTFVVENSKPNAKSKKMTPN